jgi:ABC-type multidrug transport system fused ATPase/permease subunit
MAGFGRGGEAGATVGDLGPVAAARAVLRVVDPHVRRRVRWSLVPGIALGVLEAVGVALVFPFVQSLGPGGDAAGGSLAGRLASFVGSDDGTIPLWVGIVALGALFFRTVASAALVAWQLRVVARSERTMTHRLVHTYLAQPWSFHQRRELAELTRNVRWSVWQVHNQMVTPAFTLPGEVAVVTSIVIVLVVLNPFAAGAVAVFFGIAAAVAGAFGGRRAARAGGEAAASAKELQRQVHDGLRAAKSLSVHGGGDVLAMRLERVLADNERSRYHMSLAQYLPRYVLEATLAAGVGGLAVLLSATSNADPVPSLALFATGGVRVVGPLSRLLTGTTNLRSGAKALGPIAHDLMLPAVPRHAVGPRRALGRPPVVELRDLSFSYPGEPREAVHSINLRIDAGALVAITGKSAAGKTTLIDVVLGLLRPTAGAVLVDGTALTDATLPAWLERLGYVPQDAVVLDDTVVRNVALGVPDDEIDTDAVVAALRDAELLATVERLPGGLQHGLGDRDGRLSGGERQRLAIARALYRNPDMLVLDEPTSSLDGASEALLLDTIRALRGHRTVLLVTHRPAAAERCDRVVGLDHGRIVSDHVVERAS